MTSLLAIDSGHPDCACAVAQRLRLVWVGSAGLQTVSLGTPCAGGFDRVVVEVPQADGRAVPVDDLIRVATTGVRLAERFASRGHAIEEYRPREWKGSTPKPPHHARMWKALSPAERELLGGEQTHKAILAACKRGAQNAWRKPGATYYRARELPVAASGTKITHDILDAVALALYALKRIPRG